MIHVLSVVVEKIDGVSSNQSGIRTLLETWIMQDELYGFKTTSQVIQLFHENPATAF